jgi:tetratricopeptide (TPR) repeat protein
MFYFQGNEYFKQKKFTDAIECYSRSIGLSPTAVTFANRAMAYLKLRRQVTLGLYASTSPYAISSFVLLLLEVPHLDLI